jgi:hypothetical protein
MVDVDLDIELPTDIRSLNEDLVKWLVRIASPRF